MEEMDLDTVLLNKKIPENQKEQLIKFLVENYKSDGNELYLNFNEEYLLVGKHKLNFKNNKKEINILVYYPKNFPKEKPEFYFEWKKDIFISKEYEEEVIGKVNLQINLFFFCEWDSKTLNLKEILFSFKKIFETNYPFIQKKKENKYKGNCKFEPLIKVKINNKIEAVKNSEIDNIFSLKKEEEKNKKKEKNNKKKEKKENNSDAEENDIKGLMIKEILYIINDNKILETQLSKIESSKKSLLDIKESLNLSNNISSSEIKTYIKDLKELKKKYIDIEKDLQEKIKEFSINLNNIDSFIEIGNPKQLKYISLEKTLEEYLHMIKKLFSSKIINFDKAMITFRRISLEIFNLKYLISKEI